MSSLRIVPITFKKATEWIKLHHSHLSPPRGWLCGVSVVDGDNNCCCVAVLGRPVARALQDGVTAEITRVASNGTPHCSSKAIASLTRAAIALGYTRIVSYTLESEVGHCYIAAGWVVTGKSRGGSGAQSNVPATVRNKADLRHGGRS